MIRWGKSWWKQRPRHPKSGPGNAVETAGRYLEPESVRLTNASSTLVILRFSRGLVLSFSLSAEPPLGTRLEPAEGCSERGGSVVSDMPAPFIGMRTRESKAADTVRALPGTGVLRSRQCGPPTGPARSS